MTNQILTPTPTPEQVPIYLLNDRQALALARQACAFLLWGQPEACTFDRVDLEIAVARLGELQAALEAQEAGDGR
jgi:hypothetical protein